MERNVAVPALSDSCSPVTKLIFPTENGSDNSIPFLFWWTPTRIGDANIYAHPRARGCAYARLAPAKGGYGKVPREIGWLVSTR